MHYRGQIASGLALEALDYHGQREVSHSGSTGGYSGWMARYPNSKLDVALLCNASDADTPILGGRSPILICRPIIRQLIDT